MIHMILQVFVLKKKKSSFPSWSYLIISLSGTLGFILINRLGACVIYLTSCSKRRYDNTLWFPLVGTLHKVQTLRVLSAAESTRFTGIKRSYLNNHLALHVLTRKLATKSCSQGGKINLTEIPD